MKEYYIVALVLFSLDGFGQTGPGGVGTSTTNVLWLNAGDGVFSDNGSTKASSGDNVFQWNDISGNSKHASHSTSSEQPNYQTGVLNGHPTIRFTADNQDRLLSTGVATGNAASVWVVASYSSLPSTNPGLIQGAPAGSAFNDGGTNKVIGMWVNNGAGTRVWGRGVQSNGTIANISQNTTLSANSVYIVMNRYNGSSTINQYVNNAAAGGVSYNGTLADWSDFGIGRQGIASWQGDIAEVVVYNTSVNDAQRIIIDNYLAAKYGLTLSVNDVYTQDNTANGNFDYQVAGIGRVDASNIHNNAKGPGRVRVSNPTQLGNGEYFMWGHDGTPNSVNTTDVPGGVQGRLTPIWAVSEVGEVGNIDIEFDLSGLGTAAASDLRLLVDTDGDGIFNEATTTSISGATASSGTTFVFSGVSSINNGMKFTLATTNLSQTPLPVELISFEGSGMDDRVRLSWTTASELNNAKFDIERSVDGSSFYQIGTVIGAGNSLNKVKYAYEDFPYSNQNYYRLRQVDFDGTATLSKIISVETKTRLPEIVGLYPNPVKIGQLITIKTTDAGLTGDCASLHDLFGKQVEMKVVKVTDNSITIEPADTNLPGVYILRLKAPYAHEIYYKVHLIY